MYGTIFISYSRFLLNLNLKSRKSVSLNLAALHTNEICLNILHRDSRK